MPRFFITDPIADGQICLTGETAKHILRVLRMRVGETLTLCDGAGTDYQCTLTDTANDIATCQVEAQLPSVGEPCVKVTLYMALPKGDKMDLIVQKAVELGVTTIVPYISARCVARPDGKSMAKKQQRWQKIALEAAMQSRRGIVPTVADCLSFAQATAQAATHATALCLYEDEQTLGLRTALSQQPQTQIAFLVGPEGGFDPSEVALAAQAGVQSVSLGKRILRCETAPLAALAAILYACNEM